MLLKVQMDKKVKMMEIGMNNRIQELAIRSYVTVGDYSHCESMIDPQKFTQLIIEESIKVMKEHDYHADWLGEKIKQHFGVEK